MPVFRIVWHFVVHIGVGMLLFVGIGSAAVLLHFFVKWAESNGIFYQFVIGLQALEFFLFAIDTLCFVWFMLIIVYKFLKDLTGMVK